MNVASLELCKELYELSGWDPKGHDYYNEYNGQTVNMAVKSDGYVCPAYDLGYLLRQLRAHTYLGLTLSARDEGFEVCHHRAEDDFVFVPADTPENQLCKLAIQLFREGILKREDDQPADPAGDV